MVELSQPFSHTILAIYEAYERRAGTSNRDNYGIPISAIAHPCDRHLWYNLRWAANTEFIDAVKQRRFDTGNLEEDRLFEDLEAAGIEVERTDPRTGAQIRIELASNWLRGYMDGRALGLPEAPKTVHVVECKSHNDKSFRELFKGKLRETKPEHYAQCQAYMHGDEQTRCLYLAVNKNTDELYAERIEYDAQFAAQLVRRAQHIVASNKAPSKLSDDPAFYVCGWCNARDVCHFHSFARVNCRTCIHCSLCAEAVMRCEKFNVELDYDAQQKGCPYHLYLPDLVPGVQVDANELERSVTYKLHDGTTWVDQYMKDQGNEI